MSALTFDNPTFCVYAIAAALMVGKMMTHSWITVFRMLKVNAGFRLAEDAHRTPFNPNPSPQQLESNEYVERSRRIHQNEVENVPLFLGIGLLYVCTAPGFVLACVLFGAYVLSRFAHFFVVMTALPHDARAVVWAIGSFIIYAMAIIVIVQGIQHLR